MDRLSVLRTEIDKIDRELSDLYLERLKLCRQIADYKADNDLEILDKAREESKLKDIEEKAENPNDRESILRLYRYIMSESKKIQIKHQEEKA